MGGRDTPEGKAKRAARELLRYHTEPDVRARFLAVSAVGHALARGELVKPDRCSKCGAEASGRNLHAHHHKGYAEEHRLTVEWLCRTCHDAIPKVGVVLPDPAHPEGPGLVAAAPLPVPADRNPAIVYLQSKRGSTQWTMKHALRTAVLVLAGQRVRDVERRVDWSRLRAAHVKAIRARLLDGASASTVNKVLTALRGVAQEAWEQGVMPHEEYQRILHVPNAEVPRGIAGQSIAGRVLTDGEIERLFQACTGTTWEDRRNTALFAVLLGSGLRRVEALALDVVDFRDDLGAVHVRHGKRGKTRLSALSPDAMSVVRRWCAGRKAAEPMFPQHEGGAKRLPVLELNRLCARVAVKAAIERFTPHDLRRTFATRCFDAGADLAAVQAMMGHSNPQTTRLYDRRAIETHFREVAKMRLPIEPTK